MITPYGSNALLIQCEDTADAHRTRAALLSQGEWSRVRCGVDTVTVEWDGALPGDQARRLCRVALTAEAAVDTRTRHHVIDVTYDGDDLTAVAEVTGMTADDVIAAHTAPTYTVAFVGFSPGFGYLCGGDPRLILPRLATPRTRVPAGAVGIAGDMSCIYPAPSPGGWNLLGRTTTVLFNPHADSPALLAAGDTLTFKAIS